jgi:cytochrome c oxidase assembly protein subunit 15
MKAESGGIKSSFVLPRPSFSAWPHRLALVLACATFPLLFIGGLVTSKGAGLAVPDWPTTFGYNMFLYPWSKMIGGIFYEHSHRLVASMVGLLTIALAVVLWLKEPRSWLRFLGTAALGLVILQGVIGGLRVVLLEDTLAIIHAGLAQAFFALTVALAVFTSSDWRLKTAEAALDDGRRLFRLALITTILIYMQSLFGAVLRHTGTRLDGHLLFAALVSLHVLFIFVRVRRSPPAQAKARAAALLLTLLLGLQLLLGIASYLGKFTSLLRLPVEMVVFLTTVHLVIGAFMLAAGVVLTLTSYRFSLSQPSARREVLREQLSV